MTGNVRWMTTLDARVEARFWNKVDRGPPDQCWNWLGPRQHYGHGRFHHQGKSVQAHRFSFELAGGNPAAPVVRHRCDNPSCVNPAHLEPGTQRKLEDKLAAAQTEIERSQQAGMERAAWCALLDAKTKRQASLIATLRGALDEAKNWHERQQKAMEKALAACDAAGKGE